MENTACQITKAKVHIEYGFWGLAFDRPEEFDVLPQIKGMLIYSHRNVLLFQPRSTDPRVRSQLA